MFEHINVESIRILPNDKITFKTEQDFKTFIINTLIVRGGLYYFPNLMMNCPNNTLVLFQYDGMIRAMGVLVDSRKVPIKNEQGVLFAGYYKFDVNTLIYLDAPIDKADMKRACPPFAAFNQSKQKIDIRYLDAILTLIKSKSPFSAESSCAARADILDSEIEKLQLLGEDQSAVVKVRVNQNIFRDLLTKRYSKCCLCGVTKTSLLIASHIKPWSKCTAEEKLDIDNGFLFCPNHDKVFDGGLITFDDNGCIIISEALSADDRLFLNVQSDMRISLTENNKKYLSFHREVLFKSKGD